MSVRQACRDMEDDLKLIVVERGIERLQAGLVVRHIQPATEAIPTSQRDAIGQELQELVQLLARQF
jgi:hypothetical protein